MENAVVVGDDNQPLTNGPVPFIRVPIAGEYVRVNGQVMRVASVLFTSEANNVGAYVKVVAPPQG